MTISALPIPPLPPRIPRWATSTIVLSPIVPVPGAPKNRTELAALAALWTFTDTSGKMHSSVTYYLPSTARNTRSSVFGVHSRSHLQTRSTYVADLCHGGIRNHFSFLLQGAQHVVAAHEVGQLGRRHLWTQPHPYTRIRKVSARPNNLTLTISGRVGQSEPCAAGSREPVLP